MSSIIFRITIICENSKGVKAMKKASVTALIIALCLLLCSCSSAPVSAVKTDEWNTNYKNVFVHGLSGWGSYDKTNKHLKYWGMFNGDLLKYLGKQGFECYAASVDPQGSAWDRACELYAQLTGSKVDYGKEHSERCKHERYGKDFGGEPLIEGWSAENKINLIGHSFGGATVRMLCELMANGSEAERAATDENELSELFKGGKVDWIYSVVTLAAPHNGTSAYLADDGGQEEEKESSNAFRDFMSKMVSKYTAAQPDGRDESDYASYDMYIDNALELNKRLQTLDNIYYFSYACSSTVKSEDGSYLPDKSITESTFLNSAERLGRLMGTTEKGFTVDESWLENDGLVNTVSAKAPFGAPSKEFDENDIQKGVWNIMPIYRGDHMSLQGGLFIKNDVKDFYTELLSMINQL